jgi:hypothetical protein
MRHGGADRAGLERGSFGGDFIRGRNQVDIPMVDALKMAKKLIPHFEFRARNSSSR